MSWWRCFLLEVIRFSLSSAATAAAKSLQSCPTLCDPTDGSPPGSPVPGILQARTLEWVAISFSNAWKWKVKVKSLCRAQLLATPWTVAFQAPPSMGFSRQEYWSGVPLPSPLLVLCTCISSSFTRFRKFSVIISLNKLCVPFSLSFPGIPIILILPFLIESDVSLEFLFCVC